jgi:hypothetical protein
MLPFIISISLSAFLLFLVEPLIGKTLLPWFGGSPAVWTTAVLFFQVLLTAGYAYAAWLSPLPRRRARLHLVLLVLSLVLMLTLAFFWRSPITPSFSSGLPPSSTLPPELHVFVILLIAVGLPFFLLAANSTLVQAWVVRLFPSRTPYRLYALSNFASLLALLAYPFLLEPNLNIPIQGWIWTVAYWFFAGLAALTTIRTLRRPPQPVITESAPEHRPPARHYVLWLSLSACASIMFLSTTSYLTQEVAVVPFLWVLPLAIYLLSFVLAFSGSRFYSRQLFIFLFLVAILLYEWAMSNGAGLALPWQILTFSFLLFVACVVCHGELYRLRPSSSRLPTFYLLVSVGGALGGIMVALLAPAFFKGYWEFPLGVFLFSVLFLVVGRGPKRVGVVTEILANVDLTILIIAVFMTGLRAYRYIGSAQVGSLFAGRNFYGVVHVVYEGNPGSAGFSYQMVNGNTVHGTQFPDASDPDAPTLYYGRDSGIGLTLLNVPRPAGGLNVGALGLGVGTIASYARPGDSYTFFEINPLVISLAQGQGGYFTYLRDSKAALDIIPGDARLSMENQLAAGDIHPYDVLVLDVFSNDAIPVHLLDEQAFSIYLQFLKPGGILAAHISSYYLDLVPVVWTLADHFHLARSLIIDPGNGQTTTTSTWFLMSRDSAALALPAIASHAESMQGYTTSIPLWTDDYSNLFRILRH